MDGFTIVFIALGLAMDAFAVSIASGVSIKGQRRKTGLLLAASFSFFQMFMPVIGYFVGVHFSSLIMEFDHWIAFGLLAFIGCKMIYDSTKKDDTPQSGQLKLSLLLTLSVATSIDALMVGLSFAFLQTSLLAPIAAIGAVTFSLSCIGFFFGNYLGSKFGDKIKIVGGLILIAIGIQILLEHLLII
ncbi:MAG: manganese efflux pump MntP family protein [Candidatus Bathyarchaeota archaeon]|nr:manganese efflux pump MntP family protein [Candidatus Bathyarchaeota archaeon]